MKKTTFLIVGRHAVTEALKNPKRKVHRLFITEDALKKLNRDNQNVNLLKKVHVFYKSKKEIDNLCGKFKVLWCAARAHRLFVAFYFLLIAAQRKKQKQHQKMINALEKGDNVKTIGGVFGTVTGVKDDRVVIRIAENVKVEVAKDAVSAKV